MGLKGKFFVLEGPDWVGKSTVSTLLYRWLVDNGVNVKLTAGASSNCAFKLRDILLNKRIEMTPQSEVLLFGALQAETSRQIKQWLNEEFAVVCDRYILSTYAYQLRNPEITMRSIDHVMPLATLGLIPDAFFVLQAPLDVCMERNTGASDDRYESMDKEKYEGVHQRYANAERYAPTSSKVFYIDATRPVSDVLAAITSKIELMESSDSKT